MPAAAGPILSGADAIARALGSCGETIRRHFRDGKLPGAWKGPTKNSPIKIARADLARLKRRED